MGSKATEEVLAELHSVVAKELTRRIKGGEAQAADISAAIRFLKDNGIEADIGSGQGGDVQELADVLPFPAAPAAEST